MYATHITGPRYNIARSVIGWHVSAHCPRQREEPRRQLWPCDPVRPYGPVPFAVTLFSCLCCLRLSKFIFFTLHYTTLLGFTCDSPLFGKINVAPPIWLSFHAVFFRFSSIPSSMQADLGAYMHTRTPTIAVVCNASLQSGSFPDSHKEARVTARLKK